VDSSEYFRRNFLTSEIFNLKSGMIVKVDTSLRYITKMANLEDREEVVAKDTN
jgi:hypothetical protein